MSKLRLAEADRERLGCPEFLPIEMGTLTNREAIELRKLGFNTPRLFWAALRSQPVKEHDEVVDAVLDYEAWTAYVWLALRRAGVETDVHTLEFDLDRLEYLPDDEPPAPEGDPGKAPEPSTNSEPTS